MPKAAVAEVIVLNFGDELGRKRLPFSAALGAPPARSARAISREPRLCDELLKLLRKRRLLGGLDVRSESHVIELPAIVG